MKFDICLMNPPYNEKSNGDQLYVKFINKVLDISNKSIIITPSNAFMSKVKSKNKELIQKINKYKPELEIGNWNGFSANPNSKSCISYWDTININDKIIVNNKEFEKQEDIILISSEYLEKFISKLKTWLSIYDSIYDNCVANPKNSQYFDKNGKNKIQLKWTNKNTWFTIFPYCIASHFTTFEYKQYSDELWFGPARILVPFNKEEYAKNCYTTIHKKNGKKGELVDFYNIISNILPEIGIIQSAEKYKYFPYLDFSKSYTDEELFKMIGMKYDKEEISKILSFI